MALKEPARNPIGQRRFSEKISERRRELFPGAGKPLQEDVDSDSEFNPLDSRPGSPQTLRAAGGYVGDYVILENIAKCPLEVVSAPVVVEAEINATTPPKLASLGPIETPLRRSINMDLNTPHDTTSANLNALKLAAKTETLKRKSDSDIPSPTSKMLKIDAVAKPSRARTVLFSTKVKTHKKRTQSASMYLCGRGRNARRLGLINGGVRHSIRPPRVKKQSKTDRIETAKAILDNSSLNDYFKELEPVVDTAIAVEEPQREPTPPPDPTKKFFKHAPSKATVTLDKSLKIAFDHGRISFVAHKTTGVKRKWKQKVEPFKPLPENLIDQRQIDNILGFLDSDKENVTIAAVAANPPAENTDLRDVLLSPTSQMCSMTSGLALNSPKKPQRNLTRVLASLTAADMGEKRKLFPIFYGEQADVPKREKKTTAPPAKRFKRLAKDQMLLDAGQKRFGATQCPECSIVYHMGDPSEEMMHLHYHNAENIFRFDGWKDERVVSTFPNAKNSRIIQVFASDSKVWLRKIGELLKIVNRDLGFFDMEYKLDSGHVFLYIKNRTIVGCLVAEPKTHGYRMIESTDVDICSEESTPISCGVSRIWVASAHRKQGIATALMNSLRANFHHSCILSKEKIAFSSPTEDGKQFARKYFETNGFLVYI